VLTTAGGAAILTAHAPTLSPHNQVIRLPVRGPPGRGEAGRAWAQHFSDLGADIWFVFSKTQPRLADALAKLYGRVISVQSSSLTHSRQRPSVISAQRITVLLLRNSITLGSVVAGLSWPSTPVAAIMSQRSLKMTDIAVLPGGLRALSV
jgi:hypothetical protein